MIQDTGHVPVGEVHLELSFKAKVARFTSPLILLPVFEVHEDGGRGSFDVASEDLKALRDAVLVAMEAFSHEMTRSTAT